MIDPLPDEESVITTGVQESPAPVVAQAPINPAPVSLAPEEPVAAPYVPPRGYQTLPAGMDTGMAGGVGPLGEAEIRRSKWKHLETKLRETSEATGIGFMPDEPGPWLRGIVQGVQTLKDDFSGVMKLSPEEATKRSAGLGIAPYKFPVSEAVVQMNISDAQHRMDLAEDAARGGHHPFIDFAAGLAGGVDPVNLLAGMGVGKVLGAGAEGLVGVFKSNLLATAAVEVPSHFQKTAEGQDISMGETITQIGEGAIGGTVFHYALEGAGKALSSIYKKSKIAIHGLPPEIADAAAREVQIREELGLKQDVQAAMRSPEFVARQRGEMEGKGSPYRFESIAHPADVPMYASRDMNGKAHTESDFGPGQEVTDHGVRENNKVARDDGKSGRVGEYQLDPGKNFLNLDHLASYPQHAEFIRELETRTGAKFEITETTTLKDILHQLEQEQLSTAQEVAKELGYDGGYKYTLGSAADGTQVNAAHLFDPVEPNKTYRANPDIVPRESPEAIKSRLEREMSDPSNQADYTPEVAEKIRKLENAPPKKETDLDPLVKDLYDAKMAELREAAKTDPELAEEIALLDKHHESEVKVKVAEQTFLDCVRSNGI